MGAVQICGRCRSVSKATDKATGGSMMRHVDLCSGIGGFALGFEWAGLSKPVLFCDIEPWSRQILNKHWPDVPIYEDVKVLANDPDRNVPNCDILTAGFPCQPWSISGRSRSLEEAKKDPRHIWPWIIDIIKQKRPTWVIFENVPHLASLGGLDEVITDLEITDYATTTLNISAFAGTGAPHKRERLWIIARNVADTSDKGIRSCFRRSGSQSVEEGSTGENYDDRSNTNGKSKNIGKPQNVQKVVADTSNEGSQGRLSGRQNKEREGQLGYAGCSSTIHRQPIQDGWAAEPSVGRVAHGIPRRVDRIKGLGNAIVPQIAQRIGETIKQVEELNE